MPGKFGKRRLGLEKQLLIQRRAHATDILLTFLYRLGLNRKEKLKNVLVFAERYTTKHKARSRS